ncbi:hypothetical protein [Rhabdothermincola sp.]|uniref:hypothetical protein n=1 Tax=Rhabdothermincola sp. TaxID=2820405 RepID=UPI002FE06E75
MASERANAAHLEGADQVIDLTTIRIDRGVDPFSKLGPEERMRLLVRVLCELVAYGELEPANP